MLLTLRIERANALYHVINRGNYRQDLFINEGAHQAFEDCLFEACEKCGWVLEGFCVNAKGGNAGEGAESAWKVFRRHSKQPEIGGLESVAG